MYLEHWGLTEKPFENTPDPRFSFPSKQHREGLQKLLYVVREGKGCALLTGGYGCGKTHLVRTLVKNLSEDYEIAIINSPVFVGLEFLEEVCFQFGLDMKVTTRLDCFRRLTSLFYENLAKGRRNVLIIDEAQIIDSPDIYEEMRLLLNIQLEDRFLLTIQLVGQPELAEQIQRYPQFDQRVALTIHLEPFDRQDTLDYIAYRMSLSGCRRNVFSDAALFLVYKISGGVPRKINNLCDLCLLEGANQSVDTITEAIVNKAI